MNRVFALTCLIAICLSVGCVQRIESPKPSLSNGGASQQLSECIGLRVQVQFRRDVLGASRELPVGPETSSINGASTSLYGELISVTDSSILISEDKRLRWIPMDVVLYVQVNP